MAVSHGLKYLDASGVIFTDRRIFYPDPMVTKELWPEVTPFVTIMSTKGVSKVNDPNYKMFEHRSAWIKQQWSINNGAGYAWTSTGRPGDTPASACAVDGAVNIVAPTASTTALKGLTVEIWDSTLSTYKGVAQITGVGSNTLTLISLGNPAAADYAIPSLADNDVLMVIGNAQEEGSTSPDALNDELEVVYNSTQIFRTPIEVTGTLYATALRGYSNELARLRLEKMKEHKMLKEKTFLLGTRSYGTGSVDLAGDNATWTDAFGTEITGAAGKTLRTTMGLIPALRRYGAASGDNKNLFNINSGTYTYSAMVDDFEKLFQYLPNSGRKMALCGAGALSYWSKVGGSTQFSAGSGFQVNITAPSTTTLGLTFRELITPLGSLELVYAPALRGPYNKSMVVFDPDLVEVKQFRPMSFNTNIKTENGFDGVKDEYFSDEGVAIRLIEHAALFQIS